MSMHDTHVRGRNTTTLQHSRENGVSNCISIDEIMHMKTPI